MLKTLRAEKETDGWKIEIVKSWKVREESEVLEEIEKQGLDVHRLAMRKDLILAD